MNALRNLLVAVGAVALPRTAIALIYNLAVHPLFGPATADPTTNRPLWIAWCVAASAGGAVAAGLLCGAAVQSQRPARWRALLIGLAIFGSPLDPAAWLGSPWVYILLAILAASGFLASVSFSVGRARSLAPGAT
jgi:hypothetical protein